MGRVRKYKKLKSCDPFFRGVKNVNKGLDLPPSRKNDQASNSFRYFQVQNSKSDTGLEKKIENPFKADTRKRKKRKKRYVKNVGDPTEVVGEAEKREEVVFKRLKGESERCFLARVDIETNKKLINVQKKTRQSSDKRKRYNKERKLKFQLRKLGVNLEDAEGMDFKDLKDHISFGEVAQRPPDLTPSQAVRNTKKKCSVTDDEREKVINLYRHTKQRTKKEQ